MATRILLADDNAIDRQITRRVLLSADFEVLEVSDGTQCWRELEGRFAPAIAILDWNMPGFDGPELCRKIRASHARRSLYVILLTGRSDSEDVVLGLDAGADDFIQKPVVPAELLARVRVGRRVGELQAGLTAHIRQLEEASSHIRHLHGLIPMCCVCKRVRNDQDYWQQVEAYLATHSGIRVTHGYCPECVEKFMP
jgi:DNA-binding response OmpR family regulator